MKAAVSIHDSTLERLAEIAVFSLENVQPDTSCWATHALLVAHPSSGKNYAVVRALKASGVNRIDGFTYAIGVAPLDVVRRSPGAPAVASGRFYAMLFAGRETRVMTYEPQDPKRGLRLVKGGRS